MRERIVLITALLVYQMSRLRYTNRSRRNVSPLPELSQLGHVDQYFTVLMYQYCDIYLSRCFVTLSINYRIVYPGCCVRICRLKLSLRMLFAQDGLGQVGRPADCPPTRLRCLFDTLCRSMSLFRSLRFLSLTWQSVHSQLGSCLLQC